MLVPWLQFPILEVYVNNICPNVKIYFLCLQNIEVQATSKAAKRVPFVFELIQNSRSHNKSIQRVNDGN